MLTALLHSQNCPPLVFNGDFELFDATCIANSGWAPGIHAFAQVNDCVDGWGANGNNTPDLLTPNGGIGEMDDYILNHHAGICYGENANHSEWIFADFPFVEIHNANDYDVSLNLDIAASCSERTTIGSYPLTSLTPGQLDIEYLELGSGFQNLATMVIDGSYDLQNGFVNTTLSFPQPSSGFDETILRFQSSTLSVPSITSCWIILDNVNILCNILDSNLEIIETQLPNGDSEFSLTPDGSGTPSNVSSYFWTFEDGTTSTLESPIHSIPSSAGGFYTVCVDIVDENGCCTSMCEEIEINSVGGGSCGHFVLTNGNVQDLVNLLGLNSPFDLLSAQADIEIEGTFIVDQDIQLTDQVNFYMDDGAEIEVQSGVLFRKVGGFIQPCDGANWDHVRSNGGQFYLYDVQITGAETALICDGGTGDVILCDIDDCHIAIRMLGSNGLFISHNDLDADHTGIFATDASAFVAQVNTIGASSPVVRGIRLDNASDGLLNANTIESQYRGIESNYSLAGMERNTVNNDGNAGISAFESRVFIDDNTIDGSGGSGIYFNSNADGNASHNRVSGDFHRMVQLQATQDHLIYANEVSGSGDNGIYNTNSGFNFYECNDLTGPGDYGIFNGGNSILQEFITNEFSGSAGEDFYSTSEFGPQVLTGNESWCEAHATGFTQGISGFWVSDLTPDCTETPANFTTGLFRPDTTGIKAICGTSPGPGGVPSTTFICWWIEYLSNLPPDRRNFYWVNSYHLIKRFKNNVPESEWPECIWILPIDCGLEELAEAEVEYMNALSETSNEIKSIRDQYDATISSEDRADNEAYVHALSQARIIKEQTLRELRAQQIATFSLLPCEDQMSELYITVYILRLKNQDEKLNESDLSFLRQVAGMCASEYGDVVHWAMGLLSSYTTELPETVDDCNEKPIEGRSRSSVYKDVITSKVYPNPVSTELTVDLWGATGQVLVSDITGQVIIRTHLQEGENRISVESLNSGLYLIKILAEDYEKIEKITVTK